MSDACRIVCHKQLTQLPLRLCANGGFANTQTLISLNNINAACLTLLANVAAFNDLPGGDKPTSTLHCQQRHLPSPFSVRHLATRHATLAVTHLLTS